MTTSNGVVTPGVAAAAPTYHSFRAGVFEVGQVKHYWWNNTRPEPYVYVVGVVPTVSYDACALEVTSEDRTQPDGEYEFVYKVTNVGDVTCSAALRHVQHPVTDTETQVLQRGRLHPDLHQHRPTVVHDKGDLRRLLTTTVTTRRDGRRWRTRAGHSPRACRIRSATPGRRTWPADGPG
ncbi:hypothetical protein GCM10009682_58410 [Luedemannella flava]|uniref:Uncharacterized protein n=1 Tax=Luedemannella flava TaxID=349316 RepID=A0ABP4Z2N2_9ACTN